jgi:tetratricopeptide (TPR) repeat protein
MKCDFVTYIVVSVIALAPINAIATTCNNLPIDKPTEDLHQAASRILIQEITTCDLQGEYDSSGFLRFYVDLDKGLSATSKHRSSILELALDLARDSVIKDELSRAELIYKIILNHYPDESRAMSSYGAVHIYRGQYKEALDLFNQAIAISPHDTIILGNLFQVNTLLGRYKVADGFNKKVLEIKPNDSEYVIHKLLLDALLNRKRDDKYWAQFLRTQSKDNQEFWRYFDKNFAISDKGSNFEELINIGNQWIDVGMSSDALLLFDFVLQHKQAPTAQFLKAKTFEHDKHYQLAFQSAQSALKLASSKDGKNKELYGSILYEAARLGYAAGEYERSLALLNEYKSRGYSHPHLDYMYAVNLDASGKHTDALPYLEKCSNQHLPDFMQGFCKKKIASQAELSTQESKSPPSKTIRIKHKGGTPSNAMEKIATNSSVAWLGKVVDTIVSETGSTLNIRLVAQYLQPTTDIDVEDGKSYEIVFEPVNPAEHFVVNLSFSSITEEQASSIKSSITKEQFLVARGHTAYVEMFNKHLIPGVAIEQAIFTSSITPHEQN